MFNKKIPLLGFLLLSTTVIASNQYVPVLHNLSLLYGFNPVAGPVKDLNIAIVNENGKKVYTMAAALDEKGCVESMHLNDKQKKSELILKREGRSLMGVKDWSIIVISLDENCNISSKTENGGLEEYITANNGLLISTRFMGNKVSEYHYGDHGKINLTKFYSSRGVTASHSVTYRDPVRKPQDYTLVNDSLYSDNYATENVCRYDERGTPIECDLTISYVDKPTEAPLRLKVVTQVSFH